jgi:hypothetical protein
LNVSGAASGEVLPLRLDVLTMGFLFCRVGLSLRPALPARSEMVRTNLTNLFRNGASKIIPTTFESMVQLREGR